MNTNTHVAWTADRREPKLFDLQRRWQTQHFVGRATELDALTRVLDAGPRGLYVHGPCGAGKTALLGAFARAATAAGWSVVHAKTEGTLRDATLDETWARLPRKCVLLVDDPESCGVTDAWVRDELLPAMPLGARLILTSRRRPCVGWRASAGWREIFDEVRVAPLALEESIAYLGLRGTPEAVRQSVAGFAHGSPLALAVCADAHEDADVLAFAPGVSARAALTLCDALASRAPGADEQAALDACAVLRAVNEDALGALLDRSDAHAAFRWLGAQPFVAPVAAGLAPEPAARAALLAALRWRSPARYETLRRRAARHYASHALGEATAHEALMGLCSLARDESNELEQPDAIGDFDGRPRPARPCDLDAMVASARVSHGAEAARAVEHWWARQPGAFSVLRNASGAVVAFALNLWLEAATAEDLRVDPVAYAAWRHVERASRGRPSGRVSLCRLAVGAVDQPERPADTALLALSLAPAARTAGLSFALFVGVVRSASLARLGAHRVAPRDAGDEVLHAIDRRGVEPEAWLSTLCEVLGSPPRERAPDTAAVPDDARAPLDRAAFSIEVRNALRNLHSPRELRDSPLVASRVVISRARVGASPRERATCLQSLLRECSEELRALPRGERLYDALKGAYLSPAPTQEAAAEAQGTAYSTYRRHVARAVESVAEALWDRDLEAASR